MNQLRTKLRLPSSPPDPAKVSPDIIALSNIISTRYVGAASLTPTKMPQEGFQKQGKLLEGVRKGYQGKVDRVYRLSKDQQAVFEAGLQNFSNFGGHGSGTIHTTKKTISRLKSSLTGKTLLEQSCIIRDAEAIVSDPDSGPHSQIICIWQDGADALIDQYKDLVSQLPKAENLEVKVMTKKEVMKKFKVKEETVETTYQINAICRNASMLVPDKILHIYIDECWVTVPKKFSPHLTAVNPNEVVGHIPFMKDGVLFPWSELDPGQVKLSVAVMPDCQHLLEKDLITAPPPQQGPVLTVYAPKSFR